ncbi:MAG: MFS transporter [Candidatus Heimdallarchaeota archaeon]
MNDSEERSFSQNINDKSSHPNDLSRTFFLVYAISAVGTAARFISRMFIELYTVVIRTDEVRAFGTALALITSLRNLIQLAFQSSFGRISDFLGRKTLIMIGLFGSGITLALFPLIRNVWVLVIGVVVFSIFIACYSPAFTALLGDLTRKENRASLLNLVTLIGAIASLICLLAVGFLSTEGSTEHLQYTIILESAAGLFIITGLISIFLTDPPTEKLEKRGVLSFAPLRENKRFRNFTIVGSLMGFSMSLGWPVFPVVRQEYATAQQNTYLWAAFSGLMILALLATKPFIDKMSRKWVLFIGRIVMFFVPLNLVIAILWVPEWWFMAIGTAVSGIGNGFYMVGESAYILDSATEKEKGTYTGLFYFFLGIATFFGSLISGVLRDVVEPFLGEWQTIIVFLWIITAMRFSASLGFVFLKEPKNSDE